MSLVASIKKLAHLLLPPIVFEGIRLVWRRGSKPLSEQAMEYAPDGWQTARTNDHITDWNVESVIDIERAKWDDFCRNLQGTGPRGFSHEARDLAVVRNVSAHNVHITYAYVLAQAAHQKMTLSVLDWGGALGHYYLLGKAVSRRYT